MPGSPITAFEAAHQRGQDDPAAALLTLERLFDRYTAEGRHHPDGSLKTALYLEHVRQTGCYLAQFFGTDQLVSELTPRSEEHTSELQSQSNLVCRLLLEKKKK